MSLDGNDIMNVAVGERPLLVVIESFGSRAYYEIARNDRFLKKEKKKRREEKETFETHQDRI